MFINLRKFLQLIFVLFFLSFSFFVFSQTEDENSGREGEVVETKTDVQNVCATCESLSWVNGNANKDAPRSDIKIGEQRSSSAEGI